ncbi:MAG: hypothetical protein ACLSWS_13625 [Faecalispora jeddahensis]
MVLLMSCTYAAMQISPAHICLFLCCDYFKISIGSLIKDAACDHSVLSHFIPLLLFIKPVFFLMAFIAQEGECAFMIRVVSRGIGYIAEGVYQTVFAGQNQKRRAPCAFQQKL